MRAAIPAQAWAAFKCAQYGLRSMQPSACAHYRSWRLRQRPHGPVNSSSGAWLPRVSRFSLSWATRVSGPQSIAARTCAIAVARPATVGERTGIYKPSAVDGQPP